MSPHCVPTLPVSRSRISSSTGVYCCPQPGPGSCQHPAEGGRKGCSLATASWPGGAVASQSRGEASEHLGHQETMVSLPAGVRGPGEVTLTCPYPPVMGHNPSWKALLTPGLCTEARRGCQRDGAMSCPPRPTLDAGSGVQSSQTPYIPLRDPCKRLRAQ